MPFRCRVVLFFIKPCNSLFKIIKSWRSFNIFFFHHLPNYFYKIVCHSKSLFHSSTLIQNTPVIPEVFCSSLRRIFSPPTGVTPRGSGLKIICKLPRHVSKRFVRLRHLVSVLFLLHSFSFSFSCCHDFISKF